MSHEIEVTVTEKGGAQRQLRFSKGEVTIGRVKGNDVVLPAGNVSKRHTRVVDKEGRFVVVDLKSTNGTYLNGRRVTSPSVLKHGDKLYVGDFVLTVVRQVSAEVVLPVPEPLPPVRPAPSASPPPLPVEIATLPPPRPWRGELWQRLVVAAVSSGKEADEAVALAEAVLARARQ